MLMNKSLENLSIASKKRIYENLILPMAHFLATICPISGMVYSNPIGFEFVFACNFISMNVPVGKSFRHSEREVETSIKATHSK